MKLVANMVGRNESGRYLKEVLEHLGHIADEIVFTDDCSDDDTAEIAASCGANVYRMPEPMFGTHEGVLRNSSWKNLSNHAEIGDWILAIDCDEKLWAERPNVDIRELMRRSDVDVINIKFFHMWNETHFRVDKAWAPTNSSRMFRYFLGGQFVDRRLACGSEPNYVQTLMRRGRYLLDSGLIMQHLGYVRDEDKQAKYERYMNLDGGDFHARAHLESIIDPNPTLELWNYGS
jgi:glycosyltransferase involved in cell wall biosynthesis